MPSYFYGCRKCCKVFTVTRKMEECEQPAICPDCGKSTTKRVILGPFFVRRNASPKPSPLLGDGTSKAADQRPWTARMVNCEASDCETGIKISGDARIQSHGLKLRGNRTSIDIDGNGELHGFNTDIE
jgi:putative FmdB family regulatory protein